MAVDLEWYRVFYHVARCGGITRAAQELYISQPAVSQCIRQLEQELKCSLLIRGSKGVTLTAEGRALFQFVEAGISELSRGEQYMRQIAGLEEGRVSIGASDLTLEFFLLEHLQAFHKTYPGIHIHVTNGPTPEALRQLQAGQVDFAAVTDPIAERQPWMQVHPVRPIREIFVASRSGFGHLEGVPITPEQLCELPLICLEKRTSSWRFLSSWLEGYKLRVQPEFELATSGLIVQFAMRDMGIGCISEPFARPYLDSGKLFALNMTELPPQRNICLVTVGRTAPSHAAEKLIESLLAEK